MKKYLYELGGLVSKLKMGFICCFFIAFTVKAQIISTIAGVDSGGPGYDNGYTGDGGLATLAKLNGPNGIAVDLTGNIYIADATNNVIRKINTAGIITTVVGTGYGAGLGHGGYNKPGGPGTLVELDAPNSVAVDTLGNVYFCDVGNNVIRKLLTTGNVVTIAGNATGAGAGTGGYSGDGGPATLAQLTGPESVAVDRAGNVFIADWGNNVIRKVNTAGIISTVAGNNSAGLGYSGDGGQATLAQLSRPGYIAVDMNGNVYVSDNNNCIRKINTNGIINTIVGGGNVGYTGDGGLATAAKTHYPAGMTIDMSGNIYFGDIDNHVVRKINAMGIISTVVGNGINGYSGDGGPATLAEINSPSAVAIDAGNNFYISDGVNSVVRKVTHVNTVGINQITENLNRLNIYPNPNSGNFTIETNSVSNQTMQVYDINGKLILSQNINGITTIDASNLSNGIYNVNIIDNASVSNKKMVIIK